MTEKGLAFYFNASACSGCKACQVACKDKHDLETGVLWRRVYETGSASWSKGKEGGWTHQIAVYNLSVACNHCRRPLCLTACPSQAIRKRRDGIVTIDAKKCVGCRYCEWNCPYGALQFDHQTGIMSKCHFCYDLIDSGKPPACVTACPLRVLDFGPADMLKKKYSGSAGVYPLPDPSVTLPSLIIQPHAGTGKARRSGAKILNREEIDNEK